MESELKLARLKLFLVILISVLIAGVWLVIVAIDLQSQKERLYETVQSQSYILLEAAKHENKNHLNGALHSEHFNVNDTIGYMAYILNNAYKDFSNLGKKTEFVLGTLKNDSIYFLSRLNDSDDSFSKAICIKQYNLAVPLRLSLTQKTGGTTISKDYKGTYVVAAYQPIPELHMGLVAKIKLKDLLVKYILMLFALIAASTIIILISLKKMQMVYFAFIEKIKMQRDDYAALNEEYLATNEELSEAGIRLADLNEGLAKALKKAEESDRLKDAFLCNMSHEIRSPMNAILGFSELLMRPGLDEYKKLRFLKLIKDKSLDLLRVIEDILDISKIEVGQLSLIETKVNLKTILNELADYYQLKLENIRGEKKLTLHFKINSDNSNSSILIDKQRLKQILTNLLDNAIKFTLEGKIELNYTVTDNKEILFIISDTGIGIPADKQHIVFDRFRQAEDFVTSKKFGGSGLGLSIVKGLVEMMGGKIWFETVENEGTKFFFTLPLKTDLAPIYETKPVEDFYSPDWSKKTILIVEDDQTNSELINEIISSTLANKINAYTAKEAIELFEQHHNIDLVLLDIRLPDDNGFNVVKVMKKIRPHTPVVAQTAYASEEDRKECLNAGCNGYISKPIQYNNFIRTVDHFINLKEFVLQL
jgi:signal transduction histidine kinase